MQIFPQLFWIFFRIGLFTLGGGYAMLPLIERAVVEKKRWLDAQEFLDTLAIAQSLPGPIAVNTGVFVGYKRAGLPGAVFALAGVVAPSFICMVVIAMFFVGIKDNATVAAIFTGIRPAVAALIAASVWSLARKAKLTWKTGGIALASALAVWAGGVSPAYVVLALALVGVLFPVARREAGKEKADLEDGVK